MSAATGFHDFKGAGSTNFLFLIAVGDLRISISISHRTLVDSGNQDFVGNNSLLKYL